MFLMNYNMGFILLLTLFSMVALNFNSLFFIWIFMELNLLMAVPLLLVKSSFMKEQSSLVLKYFLIQVIGSIFILVCISFLSMNFLELNSLNIVLMVVFMLKSGVPPLHFWFPQVMYNTNPLQAFIMLCVQKIIPLFLISLMMSEFLLMFIVVSSIMGGVSGLNQNALMKILSYSSMVHSSWMITGMFIKSFSGYFYFLIYSTITYFFINMMSQVKVKFISEIISSKNLSFKIIFIMSVMTLSGTPPFIGFFSKIYILFSVLENKLFLVSAFLIMGSTISFFFYARMIILSSIFFQKTNKDKSFNMNFNFIPMIFMNLVFFSAMVFLE